jgi:hypothetical protein
MIPIACGDVVEPRTELRPFSSGYAGNPHRTITPGDTGVVVAECGNDAIRVEFWKAPHYGSCYPWTVVTARGQFKLVEPAPAPKLVVPVTLPDWNTGDRVSYDAIAGVIATGMLPLLRLSLQRGDGGQEQPYVLMASWQSVTLPVAEDVATGFLAPAIQVFAEMMQQRGWNRSPWGSDPWPLQASLRDAHPAPLLVESRTDTWYLHDGQAWYPPRP